MSTSMIITIVMKDVKAGTRFTIHVRMIKFKIRLEAVLCQNVSSSNCHQLTTGGILVIYSPYWPLISLLNIICQKNVSRDAMMVANVCCPPESSNAQKKNYYRYLTFFRNCASAVPAIGIMVILLFYIIIKKLSISGSTFFWEKKTENYQNVEAFLKNCGSLSPKRYTYSDIKKITKSFRTKIGQGGFGCVFKGKLENDCLVVVKVLKGLKGNGEEFINEVAAICRTSHINIVTLLGFCFEGRHRAPIYEFMPNQSLDKFIHDGGSLTYLPLSWEALYRIVVGIARVLNYINPSNTPSISFTISPKLTIFKCNTSSPKHANQTDEYFIGNYTDRGRACHGYTVYSSHPNQQVPVPTLGSYPKNCDFSQLPVVSSIEDRYGWNPFSFLTSDFSVEYHVSDQCHACLKDGGQCPHYPGEFICLHERGGSPMEEETQGPDRDSVRQYKTLERKKEIGIDSRNRSLSPKRYTYSDIKKIINSFRTKLGQGGFGCVFKGKLENDCPVAVKVLKGLKGNGEEFINEVAIISRTSHVNIVTLQGFCFEGRHRALIYEFMPNGSLDKFIQDGGSLTYHQLSWEALYQIVVGIARGLEYLHRGCNTRIVHFDIKPHNILLNEDFRPKISNFGLAKLCPQKESIILLTGARGTVGYIAPEVFSRHFGGVSHKSDVYSYGMMVLEMVGVRKNISIEVDHSSEIYFPHWVYKRLEADEELGLHGNMDDEANASARKMIIVGLWCIQTDPSHRPSMSRVVEMLEGRLESLQIPPKPFLSSPSRSPVEYSSSTQMSLTM
ncbi:hypothetical protein RHMOL_Rhmol09G0152200 [Rhododendron molle]|uniref:Uncharacterized protein n=1 Tax=Rhododendron molle TaxID=49168 RepID=A0ACC0MDN8_RHOML|nr:hypothetical protein RHMOL_Rhmol09G0152200 [Rhododendron molle]